MLINFSLAFLSLFPLNFSNFHLPKSVREVTMVEWVVLVFIDGNLFEICFSEVPVMYCIPSKFFQKASATFCAVLSGFGATFTDEVMDRGRSAWNGDEFVCAVDLIAGVNDKRNVCMPAGCWGVGANRGQREFAASFEEREVCDESPSEKSTEVEGVWVVAE